MNRADFETLIEYSNNCWRLLQTTLQSCPELFETPFTTTSKWNTIRLLLAHCIAAEERWISLRLRGREVPIPYEERAAATLDGIFADWWDVRTETHAYLDTLSEADLEEEKVIDLAQWNYRGSLNRSEALYHLFNHDNYHRGQVVMALQRFGVDPPNFDFVFLKERPD